MSRRIPAGVPLRTRVIALGAADSDALALIFGSPLYQTRLVPAARAAAKVTLRTAADLQRSVRSIFRSCVCSSPSAPRELAVQLAKEVRSQV